MKQKVIAYERVAPSVLQALQQDYDVRYFKNINPKNDPDFLAFLHEAEGVIGTRFPADRELLEKAPNLKIVSTVSVGYNHFDIDELTKRGILATNTPGVLDDTVADLSMALILATARRLPELDRYVKEGQWTESLPDAFFGVDVHHKKLGIIGMGRIGQAIAQRAHFGFNMDILYNSRTPKPEAEKRFAAVYRSLEDLLRESDFVLLITPLTPETEELIGKKEFELMKQSAIFINVSRGGTVVEPDLIEALQTKEIAAAGLDVFAQEPVAPANPLLQMDNVVTLPHIGSSTAETELKMAKVAEENLRAGLRGERPGNLIDGRVWNTMEG
ncbi:d-isomer specific 2-hydroxyacid dehydrogenase [Bacillus sp. OxB-1]|uniref:2-hydroxyacid dehydrogenase n=1 Tax=Bacillus sp. (strain OxB-1) TaxID=98228 RepID=UPI00058211B8|nr:D-glycerate dehydrogenase [Bacillus sp. OxB-1]BAQ11116.1 d-isomer specific 2-hydroxyacid dehydrogenase [Bacillus sp. OxB-1]